MRSRAISALTIGGLATLAILLGLSSPNRSLSLAVSEYSHDFGIVRSSQLLRHTFVVSNESDRPWHVERVVSSCGCTEAVATPLEVAPGADLRISLSLNPEGRKGRFDVRATCLLANLDPIKCRVGCDVQLPFAAVPSLLYLGSIVQGRETTAQVLIELNEHFEISSVDATPHDEIGVRREKWKGRDILVISVTPHQLGRLSPHHAVRVTCSNGEQILVPILAYVSAAIVAVPSTLIVSADEPMVDYVSLLPVDPSTDSDIRVIRASFTEDLVSAAFNTGPAQSRPVYALRAVPGARISAGACTFTVQSGSDAQFDIKVPVLVLRR